MYNKPNALVEAGRIHNGPYASTAQDENNGLFVLEYPETKARLVIIASDGGGWEHVSVSIEGVLRRPREQRRCPRWEEMAWVASLFWTPTETVVQYRPPADQYRNLHPYTLHWFRPIAGGIPLPPALMVAPAGVEYDEQRRELVLRSAQRQPAVDRSNRGCGR